MSDWKNKTLSQLATIQKGKQINRKLLSKDGDYYVLNGGQSASGYFDEWNTEGDTISISEGGNSCGYVAYNREKFWSGGHNYTLKFLSPEIDLSYLYHYLKYKEWEIMRLRVGSGLPNIQKKDLSKVAISYAEDKKEQEKIAQILSTIDRVIEKTKAVIDKYRAIREGLLQTLLTNGVDEQGNIRSPKTHKYKPSPLGDIPEEWDCLTMELLTQKIADRDHTTPEYVVNDGVLIVSPVDFDENDDIDFSHCAMISKEAHEKNKKRTDVRYDDLVFTRIGAGLGKVCYVSEDMPEFSILHSACQIRTKKILKSKYLCYFIKSKTFQNQIYKEIQSIGVPDLGLDKIARFYVKFPVDLKEQLRIIEKLDAINKVLLENCSLLTKYKRQKQGLMQDLLSNTVSVV